jgi:predicted component of type VI protein secretion system
MAGMGSMLQKKLRDSGMFQQNIIGERQDVEWQHGTTVNDKSRKIKCNYCHMEYSSGVFVLSTI